MKSKKILILIVIGLMATISAFFFINSKKQKGHVDAEKITAAIHAYCSDAKEHNHNLPSLISLRELITKGFLKHEDVSAFEGMEVTVYLTGADETTPQAVLMSARLPDGNQMVMLADGSVQESIK